MSPQCVTFAGRWNKLNLFGYFFGKKIRNHSTPEWESMRTHSQNVAGAAYIEEQMMNRTYVNINFKNKFQWTRLLSDARNTSQVYSWANPLRRFLIWSNICIPYIVHGKQKASPNILSKKLKISHRNQTSKNHWDIMCHCIRHSTTFLYSKRV